MISSLISIYQKTLSPIYHAIGKSLFGTAFACRFSPTCSEYTRTAVDKHGIIQGLILGLKRLVRCQPFSKGGFDPVPDKIK